MNRTKTAVIALAAAIGCAVSAHQCAADAKTRNISPGNLNAETTVVYSAKRLSPEQLGRMDCAAKKMQLFYYYFSPKDIGSVKNYSLECGGEKTKILVPDWLEKSLPDMARHKVWKDPEDGDLSEATLWQSQASILYEFTDWARKTFSAPGTEPYPINSGDLPGIGERLKLSADRIAKAGLNNALDGRGKLITSRTWFAVNKIEKITDILSAAGAGQFAGEGSGKKSTRPPLSEKDFDSMIKAVESAVLHSQLAFDTLFSSPKEASGESSEQPQDADEASPARVRFGGYRGTAIPVPGHQTMFVNKGDRIDMLVTFEAVTKENVKEKVTATILQNVAVLDVYKPGKPDETGIAYLLLNPNEAQYAALSMEQGKIGIIVRAAGDTGMSAMEMSSFRKLFR